MPEPEHTITTCDSCGNAMDVTAVAPFSNVECPTCGVRSRVKTEFGPYTLTRRLAEGGMSLVFVAMDNTLGREVALKILNEDYSVDERRIAAFEEEARITASFSHPNVVRVFTTGRAFGRFYIAMELVPGGHFERQIRERGKIPEVEILPFAVQVAEGLEAARAAGLIHRDIKPGNILLDAQGNAKIVDFGLALVTKGGSATAQEIWATPYYVPPETIEGHPEDFRSDLYAFGATLYHALAGKPPCDEESMATDKLRLAKKHIKSLRGAAPDVSDDTCAIVDKAMAYARDARYSSYEEMISQLKAALSRIKKGKAGNSLKDRAAARKREWIAMGAAGVVVVGALAAGIAWIFRAEPKGDEPHSLAVTSPEASDQPETGTLVGERYRQAREAVAAGHYSQAAKAFAQLRDDPSFQEPTRSWAAVEAVVTTFLDGRNDDARREAKTAEAHIRKTELAANSAGKRLLEALSKLHEPEPLLSGDASGDAAWAMITMLAGLKNWEQGLTDLAAKEAFEPLANAHLSAKDQWLKDYKKIAGAYLEDHQLLSNLVFASIPPDKQGCQAAINQCGQLLTQVKTQGRARFNISAFEADLRRQMAFIEAAVKMPPPNPVPPAPASPEPQKDPLLEIQQLTQACRFQDATDFIKRLESDPQGATRASLLAINESAGSFLAYIEGVINSSPEPVTLKLDDGEILTQVRIPKSGSLEGIKGVEQGSYSWADVDPESVIQFYRDSSRTRLVEADPIPRYTSAIAFDWLVGDRSRANSAAERLSQDSESFKQRWVEIQAGLPKG